MGNHSITIFSYIASRLYLVYYKAETQEIYVQTMKIAPSTEIVCVESETDQ